MNPATKFFDKRSVVTRLILYIILFSSAVTLITTSLQLYREYRRDLDMVSDSVEHLRLSQLESLTSSLWALDTGQIQLILDGIARIPDIQSAEIVDDGNVIYNTRQENAESRSRTYSFPLVHTENGREFALGELRVIVDLQGIYRRLLDRIGIILLSNGIRTFAVSTFLFLMFQHLVTRHLKQIASHAQRLSPQTLEQPLRLNRPAHGGPPDEIDQLAASIDSMRENLRKSYIALSESEERFRHIAECIDAVFWICSNDWRQVLYVSPTYEKVWGRPCSELYRSPLAWIDQVHPNDKPKVESTLAAAADALGRRSTGSGPQRIEFAPYRVIRSDGAIHWIAARAFPSCDDNGQARYIVGICEDITQQVRTDKALVAAKEQAEQSSAAKSRFLAHMSHELRTPLNAILGFSEMLEHEILGPLQPKAYRDYAKDIQNSGRHLLSIINDILDLSRIESGEIAFKPEEIPPASLIEEAMTFIDPLSCKKDIRIDIDLPAQLPAIRADRRAIVQVLTNIVGNAVKFTPSGGMVRITGAARSDGGVDLGIADTGCGIKAKQLAELFQPFVSNNALLARAEEGTGLGLAISKRLMELQGFDIVIDSAVGRGTEVTLEFPPKLAEPAVARVPGARKAAG